MAGAEAMTGEAADRVGPGRPRAQAGFPAALPCVEPGDEGRSSPRARRLISFPSSPDCGMHDPAPSFDGSRGPGVPGRAAEVPSQVRGGEGGSRALSGGEHCPAVPGLFTPSQVHVHARTEEGHAHKSGRPRAPHGKDRLVPHPRDCLPVLPRPRDSRACFLVAPRHPALATPGHAGLVRRANGGLFARTCPCQDRGRRSSSP